MSALPILERSHDESDDRFAEIYARHRPAVMRYVRKLFPRADVESVVQDTFCRAMRHWATVGELDNPLPWLLVTARNLALNNVRDQRSEPVGLRVFDQASTTYDDPADHVHSYDQIRALGRAMDALTPLQRQLLTVLLEEGLTGAEAARRLGLGVGAARMQMCRMRARLSQRFTDLGGRLAIAPVAIASWALRRLRRGLARPDRASLAPAAGLAATSFVAASIGVVSIALTPAAPGVGALATSPAVHAQNVASVQALRPDRGLHAVVRTASATSSASPTTALGSGLVSAAHNAWVSDHPTRDGKNAGIYVQITTPVTSLSYEIDSTQHGDVGHELCLGRRAC